MRVIYGNRWAGRSVCSTQNLTVLPSNPYEQEIINTLIAASKNHNTQKIIAQSLRNIRKHVDLMNPAEVKAYITDALNEKTKKPLSNNTKRKLTMAYDRFCKSNGLQWTAPKFKATEITPIIPTTENVTKIISAANTSKFAIAFAIMREIGCNNEELHQTPRKQIDTQQAIISIVGVKGHDSKAYKLTQQTNEMLIAYLAKNPQEYPFPRSRNITRAWCDFRDRIASNLKQPELKKIQLRNLRNYSGAIFYKGIGKKDPIATMRHMRHKKLERTMHYLRAIVLDEPEEYITVAVQLGQTDTQKRIIEYLNAGYEKATEADGYQYFRIRKT